MLLLDEVKASTDKIFNSDDGLKKLSIPETPIIWKDKITAFEEAKLPQQRASCIFDMRCWQAEKLGFKKINSSEMVMMLMGDLHTETGEGSERQNYEWVYNHHSDTIVTASNWGGKAATFKRVVRTGLWHLPPFSKKTVWEAQFGKLDYLKRVIPYGVVLKINECQELKLFNVFNVLAPLEAWERKTDIDPIVVATIWEMPPKEDGVESASAGQVAHFFLAQW